MAEAISLKETRFYMRNVRTRMPFKYGAATLVSVPILHVEVIAELGDSTPARGWSADILPPKWFDKDPEKDYRDNVDDLIEMARAAARVYQETSARPRSLFGVWRDAYEAILDEGQTAGLNKLTSGHGSSLLERALVDAIGTARGMTYHELLRRDALGINLSDLHEELNGMEVFDAIAQKPIESVSIRHTVGLIDPIRNEEIEAIERLEDGLPQSLEDYIKREGIRYLKIKVKGDVDDDLERLRHIAYLCDRNTGEFSISLDGNEQYSDLEILLELLDRMREDSNLRSLYDSIIYIEQPFERSLALDPVLEGQIRSVAKLKPIVIDESDDDHCSFKRATSVGYTGVSAKNCKGLIKALANKALATKFTAETGVSFFMTAEDLMNLPVVPLQQDLTQIAALGLDHAERNGHHYVHGLDHLSQSERNECKLRHSSLYRTDGDLTRLDIRNGKLDLSSLQVAGLGLGVKIDSASMVLLEEWQFDSL